MLMRRAPAFMLFLTFAAHGAGTFDAPTAFGARPSIAHISLSPDGNSVAYVSPIAGQGSAVYTLSLAKGAAPRRILAANGNPERIGGCNWVSNDRLVCSVYGVVDAKTLKLPFTRRLAVDADGGHQQLLSTKENIYSRGLQLGGGEVIDWLPDEEGVVLMTRVYLPDDRINSRMGSPKEGLGVDRIDTRTHDGQAGRGAPPYRG